MNSVIEIEQEMDAFVADRAAKPGKLERWFTDHPDVYRALVARVVEGEMPAQPAYFFLIDRYDFPIAESTFRRWVRIEQDKRTNGRAA